MKPALDKDLKRENDLIFQKKKRSKKRKQKGMGYAHVFLIRFAEAYDQSIYPLIV